MTCWFCGIKEADSKKAIHLYMYGEIQASDTEENKKRIEYSTRRIDVPRCADCKKSHAQAKTVHLLMILMGVLLIASVLAAVAGWVSQWLWGAGIGFAVGVALMLLVLKGYILRGIKKESAAKKDFPQVVDLLGEGYRFGKNPTYEESVQINGNKAVVEQKSGELEEKES